MWHFLSHSILQFMQPNTLNGQSRPALYAYVDICICNANTLTHLIPIWWNFYVMWCLSCGEENAHHFIWKLHIIWWAVEVRIFFRHIFRSRVNPGEKMREIFVVKLQLCHRKWSFISYHFSHNPCSKDASENTCPPCQIKRFGFQEILFLFPHRGEKRMNF